MINIFDKGVNDLDEANLPEDPFRGVPMVIKDCVIMYEGKPVTLGSDLCQGIEAPYDTTLMKKFRASGAVAVGMTKAGGASTCDLLVRYILPNMIAPVIVYASTFLGLMIVLWVLV